MIHSSRQKVQWVTTAAALAIAGTGVLTAGTQRAVADPLLDLPFAEATDCAYFCRPCKEDTHDIVQATKNNAKSSHLETCNEGTCEAHACDVDETPAGELGALWFEIRETRDGDRLRELLHRHREVAYYNPERDAVQVLGCKGSVLASIPLSPTQVALLEE